MKQASKNLLTFFFTQMQEWLDDLQQAAAATESATQIDPNMLKMMPLEFASQLLDYLMRLDVQNEKK